MTLVRSKPTFVTLIALLAACGSARDVAMLPDAPAADAGTLPELAVRAVDADPETATAAIDTLRAAGPSGLAALFDAHADDVARLRGALSLDRDALDALRADEGLSRLRDAIDRVAAQRDAFASGLYWYTDLAAAQAEAARSGRPILSLRLLGRLDEEASCANSRFFRWLLYPSPAVRTAMAGYVLHWSSERPAPHVTIDMGDGRTIERTITGNSIHYVLDANGHVVDAIAGLHTPEDFALRLDAAHALATRCGVALAHRGCLSSEHRQMLDATRTAWEAIPRAGRPSDVPSWTELLALDTPAPAAPLAVVAMPITTSKAAIEMPLLDLIGATRDAAPPPSISWRAVASAEPLVVGTVSRESRSLARLKTGCIDDEALMLATQQRAAEDTVQNRFTIERRIHAWLANGETNELGALNARIYAELFLTPASDPWLGLRGADDWDVLEVPAAAD